MLENPGVEIESTAAGGRYGPGEVVVCVGDSITWEPGGYVAAVRDLMAARFPEDPPKVINAGVGGDTVRQMLGRFDRDVLAHAPDRVVIMAGVADTVWQMGGRDDERPEARGSDPKQFGRAIEKMTQKAKAAGVDVVLCTPTYFEGNFGGDVVTANRIIEQKTQELERIADDLRLLVIPTGAVLKMAREDAAGAEAALHFTTDGFHPDARGHSLMALAVMAGLGYGRVAELI